jgi:CheY-like chemotaxis protein
MSTILIVDDRQLSRSVLTTLLSYFDHHIIVASDGFEALELAQTHRPDLLIADILMPTMDGFELVRRLRLDPLIADTSVIFYTAAYLEQEARKLAAMCGVSHLLLKPSEPEVILQTVSEVLGTILPNHPQLDLEEFRDHQSRADDE